MSEPRYGVLAVCTGNICRSPTIERLLVARLRQRLGDAADRFDVGSAGTWGLVGEPMPPEAQRCLIELGGDPSGFVARELTPQLIDDADLVLAATREHRAAAVTLLPRAAAKTVTLREFARLLSPLTPQDISGSEPVERMAAVVQAAIGNRGLVPPDDPRDDDVADPYGLSSSAYAAAAQQIDSALRVPLDLLAPAAVSGQPDGR